MRIYTNPYEAVREVERDLWEMGIKVHPQTMQDKVIKDNEDYSTKEVRGYGFSIVNCAWQLGHEEKVVRYLIPTDQQTEVLNYISFEHADRVGCVALNPGNAWHQRANVWNEFMHNGKFAYTYSERMACQIPRIAEELRTNKETRQAIITIHSNMVAYPGMGALPSMDAEAMGGKSRVPCSLYYQLMRRQGKLDLIYAMRSCDFLTHFPVDIMLAMRLQQHFAAIVGDAVGTFTYFTGSLHAYNKDMKKRGIF